MATGGDQWLEYQQRSKSKTWNALTPHQKKTSAADSI
jgi:hypothetical protein